MAELKKWPFRPVHITNDGEKAPKDSPLRKLTGYGIIPNEHLRGIETTICANIQYPTAIIEFSPEKEPVRTDSPLLDLVEDPFGWHPPCRLFHKFNQNKECQKCDREHELLFCGLSESNFAKKIQRRIGESRYIQDYLSSTRREVEIYPKEIYYQKKKQKKKKTRRYLEYDCPMLGYRELIFPIFYDRKVIAVFCTGQICLEQKLPFIDKTRKDYWRKNPDCFKAYCEKHNRKKQVTDIKPNQLKREITKAHKDWIKNQSHVLNKRQHENLIKKVFYELDSFEKTLYTQVKLQSERYAAKKIDLRIRKFRDEMVDKFSNDKDNLQILWNNVESRIKALLRDFNVRYVVFFGTKHQTTEETMLLEVVAKEGAIPKKLLLNISLGTLKFNSQSSHKFVNSALEPSLL